MTLGVWIALTVVVAMGVAVQGVLGFGANLLVVPAAVVLYPEFVPFPATVVNLLLSAAIAARWWRSADGPVVRRVLIGTVPGVAVGVWLVTLLSLSVLGVLAAACVLGAVVVRLVGVELRPDRRTTVGAGVLTGFMGATSSITGPPVALLMTGRDPARGRATVAVTGTVVAAGTAVVLFASTATTVAATAADVLLVLPGVAAGALLGRVGVRRLAPRAVERLVLVVSTVSALVVIVRTVT